MYMYVCVWMYVHGKSTAPNSPTWVLGATWGHAGTAGMSHRAGSGSPAHHVHRDGLRSVGAGRRLPVAAAAAAAAAGRPIHADGATECRPSLLKAEVRNGDLSEAS